MGLTFVTVDVFADRQFGGNPLAVVIDAEGLSSRQMQAIAAEFNLAETTFVLPPPDAAHTALVRIFTPRAEMPFAGHPNVGTAFVLAREGQCHGRPISRDTLVFEEAAGLVRMQLTRQGAAVTGASLAAPQPLAIATPWRRRSWRRPAPSRSTTSRRAITSPASRAAARPSSLLN
jgi:trans-2,3-dihydro-3-hydroxyanthranilate isomerase